MPRGEMRLQAADGKGPCLARPEAASSWAWPSVEASRCEFLLPLRRPQGRAAKAGARETPPDARRDLRETKGFNSNACRNPPAAAATARETRCAAAKRRQVLARALLPGALGGEAPSSVQTSFSCSLEQRICESAAAVVDVSPPSEKRSRSPA